jgi:hypothetical protein
MVLWLSSGLFLRYWAIIARKLFSIMSMSVTPFDFKCQIYLM